MTQMKFFNTIHLRGLEFDQAILDVTKQDDRIYEILKQANREMTPFEVGTFYDELYSPVPITSIRRAMTTLTKEGKLIKTQNQKAEVYGKRNYCWRIATKAEQAWYLGEDTDKFYDTEQKAFDDLATHNERFTD